MARMSQSYQPHWYKIHLSFCPACGRDNSHRERVYGEKPGSWDECHIILADNQAYDGCMEGSSWEFPSFGWQQ